MNNRVRAAVSAILLIATVAFLLAGSISNDVLTAAARLSPSVVALMGGALLGSTLLAALRLKIVAADFGYDLDAKSSISVTSTGQLAGAMFFQVFGQIIARTVFLRQRNIPAEATILITAYERVAALLVSVVLAVVGAIFIFGELSFRLSAGGDSMLKLMVGIVVTATAGIWLGWGNIALRAAPAISRTMVRRFARCLALSIAIQLSTMSAYLISAHGFAPGIPLTSLAAASALVMFAASLPISAAGWGIREMSAVVALSAIGLPVADALVTALLIGALSVLVFAVLAMLSISRRDGRVTPPPSPVSVGLDYALWLDWCLPLVICTAVFFQVYLPLTSGANINVNLADPFAIIAGGLFVFRQFLMRQWPRWRLSFFSVHLCVAAAALLLAFIIGVFRFGWTDWAFISKLLGWLVLMSYLAAGSLIVRRAGLRGLTVLARTFAAAGVAIVVIELCILLARSFGVELDLSSGQAMQGFSQNRNAFAFMLLLVIAAAFAFRPAFRTGILALVLTGLFFAGSRAGDGTLCVVVLIALYFRAISVTNILAAAVIAALVILGMSAAPRAPALTLLAGFSSTSTPEHVRTIMDGLRLFFAHPIFGAGLGAYMHQSLLQGTEQVIHSTPVWLLAETGIVGFVAILTPIVRIWLTEAMAMRSGDAAAKLLTVAIAALGTMSLVHELLYQRGFWLLLGAALALPKARELSTSNLDEAPTMAEIPNVANP